MKIKMNEPPAKPLTYGAMWRMALDVVNPQESSPIKESRQPSDVCNLSYMSLQEALFITHSIAELASDGYTGVYAAEVNTAVEAVEEFIHNKGKDENKDTTHG